MAKDFNLNFQDEIGQQTCAIHQVPPKISFTDGKIDLQCCCIDFKLKCYKGIIEALSTYKNDYPQRNFNVKRKLTVAFKKHGDAR